MGKETDRAEGTFKQKVQWYMDELRWQVLLEATFEWRFRIYWVPSMHHPCVLVCKMHNKATQGILSHLSLNTDTKSGQGQHMLFFLLCPWPPWTLWLTVLWDLLGLVPASGKSMFPVTLLALSGWGLDLCAVINCSVFSHQEMQPSLSLDL